MKGERSMGKSLKFIQRRASDSRVSTYSDKDWTKAVEVNLTDFVKSMFHIDLDSHGVFIRIGNTLSTSVVIDTNADFDFFVSSQIVSDSTGLYLQPLCECIEKILWGRAYNKKGKVPQKGDELHYVLGNAVVLHTSKPFVRLTEKPWLTDEYIVCIPVKMWVEKSKC